MELRKIYGLFSRGMRHEEFRDFTDPTNEVGKLLQSHFVALHLIMAPISKVALGEDGSTWPGNEEDRSTARWLSTMHLNIPQKMLEYYEWPISVERGFRGKLLFKQ